MAAGQRKFGNVFLGALVCTCLWLFWQYETYQMQLMRLQQLQEYYAVQKGGRTPPANVGLERGADDGPKLDISADREQDARPAPRLAPGIRRKKPGAEEKAVEENVEFWKNLEQNFPVTSLRPLPTGPAKPLGKYQPEFPEESATHEEERLKHRGEIKAAFLRAWKIYKEHAWLHDEVAPVSFSARDSLGGWGATFVDALDTLWIMNLKNESEEAVEAAHKKISFRAARATGINVFETNIRFLGGFLSAYDLSGDERLLEKATEVGDLLYHAFDTEYRMPVLRWYLHDKAAGDIQEVPGAVLLGEFGSLSIEMTRLSLVTGDTKYFDAAQRISEHLAEAQMRTKIPGLWPTILNLERMDLDAGTDYTFGGMADSAYEYLIKMAVMLGDQIPIYKRCIFAALKPFRRITHAHAHDGDKALEYNGQHLACFTGVMLLLSGKTLSNQDHVSMGKKLTEGCMWAYSALPSGIMPESFHFAPCPDDTCAWDEKHWHNSLKSTSLFAQHPDTTPEQLISDERMPKGFTSIDDHQYVLRPEAIESVFYLYRATGDAALQDRAWTMWEAIDRATRTDHANSAVWDIHPKEGAPPVPDSMESFWLGETLKYFYLMFSEPELMSLDEWVFNTEAYPFKRLLA